MKQRPPNKIDVMRTTDTHQISIIRSAADIGAGTSALRRQCRVLRKIHDATGDPPLRREPVGFSGLAGIIVSQQLSAASANAIWRRLSGTIQPLTPAAILATSDDQLRQCGLSPPPSAHHPPRSRRAR
jgi:DNA-3-methyladenine glycosylase II